MRLRPAGGSPRSQGWSPPPCPPDSTTMVNPARAFQTRSPGMSSGGGHSEGQKGDNKTLLSFLLMWAWKGAPSCLHAIPRCVRAERNPSSRAGVRGSPGWPRPLCPPHPVLATLRTTPHQPGLVSHRPGRSELAACRGWVRATLLFEASVLPQLSPVLCNHLCVHPSRHLLCAHPSRHLLCALAEEVGRALR